MIHQSLASFFHARNPALEYAWILNEKPAGPHPAGRVYWTGFPRGTWAPSSALIKLVQSIFDRYEDQSFFLLRQKIRTTAAVSELDRAVLQLAAKRAETVSPFPGPSGAEIADLIFEETAPIGDVFFESARASKGVFEISARAFTEPEIIARLRTLQQTVPRGEILHDHNRPVAAILVEAQGRILAEAVHGGFLNKTLHAELRLAQAYFRRHRRGFPEGSRVYASLKPCRMCAAMLVKMAEGLADFQVVFVEDDPGRLARSTLLEKRSLLRDFRTAQGSEAVRSRPDRNGDSRAN